MSEATPPAFVTLAEFKEWLNLPSAADAIRDSKLDECLGSALEWLTEKLGPLDGLARTYQVWPSGRSLVLPDDHLAELVSVTDPLGTLVTVPPDRVNLLAGVLDVVASGRLRTGTWIVEARKAAHGDSVKLAAKIIASHLYDTQRGRAANGATAGILQGATPVGDPNVPKGFAIPSRAAELIRPFLRPRGL